MRLGGWWLYSQLLLLDRLPDHNVVRIYYWHWYVYLFCKVFRMKRVTYRLFSNGKALWIDHLLVPGKLPMPIRSFTLTSPKIAVLVEAPPKAAATA